MTLMLILLFSYLLAAVPFGLVLVKLVFKTDIRLLGSKNIGATNVYRNFGKLAGFVTLILDGSKGVIPVVLVKHYFTDSDQYLPYLVAFLCVIGHIFPVYLKFRGGKGVATTLFVLFALNYTAGFATLAIWCIIFFAFRMVSFASVVAPVGAIFYAFYISNWWLVLFSSCVTILIVYKHIPNLGRIVRGEEKKMF